MEDNKNIFEKLSQLNLNDKTEKKNGLTYLSWSHAWGVFKKYAPDATYDVVEYNGKPFVYDENLGYIVKTYVSCNGQTIPMQLPVLDGANKAMKAQPYKYKGTAWVNGQKTTVEKTVEAATMFDINTAIMRCLVKNLAMFGLALYIYAGEDLPEVQSEASVAPKPQPAPKPVAKEVKQSAKKEEPTPIVKDEAKEKARELFSKLDTATVLKSLIVEHKMKYTNIDDFLEKEPIEKIREVYSKLTAK